MGKKIYELQCLILSMDRTSNRSCIDGKSNPNGSCKSYILVRSKYRDIPISPAL